MTNENPRRDAITAGAVDKDEQQQHISPSLPFQSQPVTGGNEAPKPPTLLDVALSYAARGWHVFPLHFMRNERCSCGKQDCSSPAKHPRTQHGDKDATIDSAKIIAWWTETPAANIAIATGPSKLVVLDVDGEEGFALYNQVARGRPETLLAKTGRLGGYHLYYVGTGIPSSQIKGEHLDLRGSTGYVVAPGSVHENGNVYSFLNPDCPPHPVPNWVAPWVAGRSGRKTVSLDVDVFGLGPMPDHLKTRASKSSSRFTDQTQQTYSKYEAAQLRSALATIPADIDGKTWFSFGAALHDLRWIINGQDIGFEIFDEWSKTSTGKGPGNGEYRGRGDLEKRWRTFARQYTKPRTTIASIYRLAKLAGWKDSNQTTLAAATAPKSERSETHTADDRDGTRDEIRRLAKLSRVEYDHERQAAADRLKIRVTTLDKEVETERGESEDDDKQGRAMHLPEPEPWSEPVDGAELLYKLSAVIRRYVVMTEHGAVTAALWVVHTYLLALFGITPRLAITSPEKQCGKTTLLDVLSRLVWRPLLAANVSASAIFRVVECHRPTLLIDEADTFLSENEELRGILNSGHRQGGSVIRTVGEDFEPRAFSTYSACAIAKIGRLPPTLADRSHTIELRRCLPDERIERFRLDRTEHLDQLARRIARWTADNADRMRSADPDLPAGVFNRVADNWRPLLTIADAAGGEWPARARGAIQDGRAVLTGGDQSVRVLLLADVRAIFGERKADKLSSADLVSSLTAMEGRPWAEWRGGKPLSQNGLARLLDAFGISPDSVRIGEHTPKGYCLAQFDDAFARYL